MTKKKKKRATAQARMYREMRQRFRIKAAQRGIEVAELMDKASKLV